MSFPNKLFQDALQHHKEIPKYLILHTYRGSVAHGMYLRELSDDKDTMGIIVPPEKYILGLRDYLGNKNTKEMTFKQNKLKWDCVFYEVHKALNMLSKGNPNIISMLWVEPNYLIKVTPAGQLLLSHRSIFMSKKLYKPYVGYAYSQLKKMKVKQTGHRGAKRAELYEKHGYDPINASHLIRLLRMGIEMLSTGELTVERPDAPQLIEIKQGAWSLDQVEKEAERLFAKVEEALMISTLPNNVDRSLIDDLAVDIVKTAWKEQEI
jgi:predicted nucleotidyltransferase